MSTRIALICFTGMEELDLVGPWEVLRMWQLSFPDDDVDVFTVSLDDQTVTCAKGMQITTDKLIDELGDTDVLLLPGGFGTRTLMKDQPTLDLLNTHFNSGTLMTSVCTGSLVFAAAGLLKQRPATTYWSEMSVLTDTDPTIELRPDDRFVDSGEVITASGVSAGIDMALHLVVRLHSADRAREVRKLIQYDPNPPV